jgi:hypothetical protein
VIDILQQNLHLKSIFYCRQFPIWKAIPMLKSTGTGSQSCVVWSIHGWTQNRGSYGPWLSDSSMEIFCRVKKLGGWGLVPVSMQWVYLFHKIQKCALLFQPLRILKTLRRIIFLLRFSWISVHPTCLKFAGSNEVTNSWLINLWPSAMDSKHFN